MEASPMPTTVEEVFDDYRGRRAGLIKALTTDVKEFYDKCDPDKENLCLYGDPKGNWEVALPAAEVPPELPEPALGINFARDGMEHKDWLSLIAVHSDSWLYAVAFYFCFLLSFSLAFAISFFPSLPQLQASVAGNDMVSSMNATHINGSKMCLTGMNATPASAAAELQSIFTKSRLRGWSTINCNKESNVQHRGLCKESTDSTLMNWHSSKRRILNTECTDRDIGISQSREASSGGVPQFIVEIYTTCTNNCEPSDVHLNCEWFASKMVVNPSIFKRVAYNDCLVNGGQPIPRGHILHFTYENSFMYSLSFKSAKFC